MDRSSLGFPSWATPRGPRSRSLPIGCDNRAYASVSSFWSEGVIAMRQKTNRRTQGHVGRAPISFLSHRYRRGALEACHDHPARAPLGGHRSRVGALGEATSSKDQVMTYPYYVRILKPSPPTIYHGQVLAWGSHTGSYRSAMSKSKEPTISHDRKTTTHSDSSLD